MKLYHIIDSIPSRALQEAEKFLRSPYFNQKEELVELFQLLRPWQHRFTKLDKKKAYEQLRPGQAFEAKWWNDRGSELSRLLEQFLQHHYLRKHPMEDLQLKRAALKAYGLDKYYLKYTEVAAKELAALSQKSEHYRFQLWECQHVLYTHSSDPKKRLIWEEKAQHQLDLYYWMQKLALQANIVAGTQARRLALSPTYLQALLQAVDTLEYPPPLLQIYRQTLEYIQAGCSLEEYQKGIQEIQAHSQAIDPLERAFLLMIWCNLGSRRFAAGEREFIEPVFQLYQYGVAEKLFIQHGYLSGNIYTNICIMAAHAGKEDWLETFTRDHSQQLSPHLRTETIALTEAFVAFHRQQFTKAERRLRDIHTHDLSFKIRVHSLSVRCLLEAHLKLPTYYQVLSHKVTAFKRMISSKKSLSEERIQAYLNFANYALAIAEFKRRPTPTQTDYDQLYEAIHGNQSINLKNWLLEKLSQVKP